MGVEPNGPRTLEPDDGEQLYFRGCQFRSARAGFEISAELLAGAHPMWEPRTSQVAVPIAPGQVVALLPTRPLHSCCHGSSSSSPAIAASETRRSCWTGCNPTASCGRAAFRTTGPSTRKGTSEDTGEARSPNRSSAKPKVCCALSDATHHGTMSWLRPPANHAWLGTGYRRDTGGPPVSPLDEGRAGPSLMSTRSELFRVYPRVQAPVEALSADPRRSADADASSDELTTPPTVLPQTAGKPGSGWSLAVTESLGRQG
jgi:hypothetical protein